MHRFLRVIILAAVVVTCQAMRADVIDRRLHARRRPRHAHQRVLLLCCANLYCGIGRYALSRIRRYHRYFGDQLPLDVQIRTVVNGLPTTTILGETTTMNFSINDMILFNQDIPQVTGTQYAIVVHFDGAPPPLHGEGVWNGATGNLYTGGYDLLSFDDGQTLALLWRPRQLRLAL